MTNSKATSPLNKFRSWFAGNPDLAFAILLAVCVYSYFAFTNEFFFTHRTSYAIMERFAVLGRNFCGDFHIEEFAR